jgi:succinate-acetate transporter protein
MTLSTIAEEASTKDDDHVQSVNIDSPTPQIQPCKRTFGSPAAILGLMSLGTVFLSFSILTLVSGSVDPSDLAVVTITFYGGISQIIVGVWEISLRNTFSATVFAAYGGFEFVYSVICLPRVALAAAHTVNGVVERPFYNAIGIYLAIWSSITFLLLLGALQTTIPYVATHAFTVCALTCLSLNAFTGNPHLAIVGSALGIITSFSAYYSAISLFWAQHTSFTFIPFPLMMAPFNV